LNPNLFVKIESELKYACQHYGHFESIKQKQRRRKVSAIHFSSSNLLKRELFLCGKLFSYLSIFILLAFTISKNKKNFLVKSLSKFLLVFKSAFRVCFHKVLSLSFSHLV